MLVFIHTDKDVSQLDIVEDMFSSHIKSDLHIGKQTMMFHWDEQPFFPYARKLSKQLITHTLSVLSIGGLNKRSDFNERTRKYTYARFDGGKKIIPFMWHERTRHPEATPYHYSLLAGRDADIIYDQWTDFMTEGEIDPVSALLYGRVSDDELGRWDEEIDVYHYKYLVGIESSNELNNFVRIVYQDTSYPVIQHSNHYGLHRIVVADERGMCESVFL